MSEVRRIILISALCAVAIVLSLAPARPGDARGEVRLLVHAGAGIQPPLDELGKLFSEKTGILIDYSYKGSGCLLPDIAVSHKGDLYIPGELFYMQQAIDRGFIPKHRRVAQMNTVVICQQGNPKGVESVCDLGRPGMRVGLGDAEAIAIGRAARSVLTKAGCRKQVEKNTVMSCMNVVELGNAVKLGQLDAAIVWDGTAALYKGAVHTISIPPEHRATSTIPVGVLKFSKHRRQAVRFMEYLASREASAIFAKHGYSPVRSEAKARGTAKVGPS